MYSSWDRFDTHTLLVSFFSFWGCYKSCQSLHVSWTFTLAEGECLRINTYTCTKPLVHFFYAGKRLWLLFTSVPPPSVCILNYLEAVHIKFSIPPAQIEVQLISDLTENPGYPRGLYLEPLNKEDSRLFWWLSHMPISCTCTYHVHINTCIMYACLSTAAIYVCMCMCVCVCVHVRVRVHVHVCLLVVV